MHKCILCISCMKLYSKQGCVETGVASKLFSLRTLEAFEGFTTFMSLKQFKLIHDRWTCNIGLESYFITA